MTDGPINPVLLVKAMLASAVARISKMASSPVTKLDLFLGEEHVSDLVKMDIDSDNRC